MNEEPKINDSVKTDKERTIRTFVRRAGRITDAQERDYERLSQLFCLPFEKTESNFESVFKNPNPVTIEIGFGMGKATAIIAQENPQKNYLGLEVHTPGVGRLLRAIETQNLQNLRIIEFDAVEVLTNMIPDSSIAAFHIFFPDPWPKKKHHKRRLVQRPLTNLLAKKLVSGGYLYMATDWQPYAEFALEELTATKNLVNAYDGFAPHQAWRPETRFEEKGKDAKRAIHELYFRKI